MSKEAYVDDHQFSLCILALFVESLLPCFLTPFAGVCPRHLWLICFSPVWAVACFVGIASCGVNGGCDAQQQILPRKVILRLFYRQSLVFGDSCAYVTLSACSKTFVEQFDGLRGIFVFCGHSRRPSFPRMLWCCRCALRRTS